MKCNLDATFVETVCGTDGITYINECEMKKLACQMKQKVEVKHKGSCTTKDDSKAESSSSEDKASQCLISCDNKSHKRVCGSDGVTYANECLLQVHNCFNNIDIETVSDGECDRDDDDDSDNVDYDYTGDLSDKKSAESDCTKKCEKKMDPICLNGNRLFSNKCVMDVTVCLENIEMQSWQKGYCKTDNDNDDNENTNVSPVDELDRDESCPDNGCSRHVELVCGTNGITYTNECFLRQLACEYGLKDTLKVGKKGPCKGDEDRRLDESLCPPAICNKMLRQVCASNGKTYNNKCLLNAASQCLGTTLEIAYYGPCEHDGDQERNLEQEYDDNDYDDMNDEDSYSHHRAMKGAVMIVTLLALSFLIFIMFRMYRKRARLQYQQQQVIPPPYFEPEEIPQQHRYSPPEQTNEFAPTHQQPMPSNVELDVMSGATSAENANVRRNDRFPLV